MMNEDFQSPVWARHHGALSTAIHKLIDDIRVGFERLNAYEFDAPWRRPAPKLRRTQFVRR